LLADLTEFLDQALIIKGVDSVNINIHQIHIGLQESCQLLGMVGLDEQEASSTSLFTGLDIQSSACIHSARFFHLVMRFHVIEARLFN
jgi:hypothetical protein